MPTDVNRLKYFPVTTLVLPLLIGSPCSSILPLSLISYRNTLQRCMLKCPSQKKKHGTPELRPTRLDTYMNLPFMCPRRVTMCKYQFLLCIIDVIVLTLLSNSSLFSFFLTSVDSKGDAIHPHLVHPVGKLKKGVGMGSALRNTRDPNAPKRNMRCVMIFPTVWNSPLLSSNLASLFFFSVLICCIKIACVRRSR